MADRDVTGRREEVHLEDVVEVGSRVSWGAILAGAVMALAVCFVLMLLGQAIGISASDRMSRDTLSMWAAIWAIVTSMIGLCVGGFITSQCVVGETKAESVVHGIIMWGVALALMLWGTASGISPNFTAMMQVASIAGVTTEPGSRHSFQTSKAGAIPQEFGARVVEPRSDTANSAPPAAAATSDNARINTADNGPRNAANNARPHAEADRVATRATWWTLVTTIATMVAAVGGAFLGAGPEFRLLPLHTTAHRHFAGRSAVAG